MARKKKTVIERKDNFIQEQPITQTLEQNYMPYAMSVIVSRAIPEIDGFKPSHFTLCIIWGFCGATVQNPLT